MRMEVRQKCKTRSNRVRPTRFKMDIYRIVIKHKDEPILYLGWSGTFTYHIDDARKFTSCDRALEYLENTQFSNLSIVLGTEYDLHAIE